MKCETCGKNIEIGDDFYPYGRNSGAHVKCGIGGYIARKTPKGCRWLIDGTWESDKSLGGE